MKTHKIEIFNEPITYIEMKIDKDLVDETGIKTNQVKIIFTFVEDITGVTSEVVLYDNFLNESKRTEDSFSEYINLVIKHINSLSIDEYKKSYNKELQLVNNKKYIEESYKFLKENL